MTSTTVLEVHGLGKDKWGRERGKEEGKGGGVGRKG